MLKTTTGRLIAAVLILVGAMLLLAPLFSPWYSYDIRWAGNPVGDHGTQNATYYLGPPWANGTIWYTSCGGYYAPCPRETQTSYSSAGENNTGMIAATSFGLLSAGFAFGIAGGVIGVVSRGRTSWAFPVITFAVLALVLAIAAPMLFAGALPGAFSKDFPVPTGVIRAYSGPWSSFSGSWTPVSGAAAWDTWGPLIGWYLSIAAFAVLLVGVILLMVFRKDPPRPATSPP
jgi:hypothetical protein